MAAYRKCVGKVSLFLGAIALSGAAQATAVSNTKIVAVDGTSENVVFVTVSTGRTIPGGFCANPGFTTRWGIVINTDRGRAILSILLTARALNQTVTITGTGSCTGGWSGGDVENIAWVQMVP